MLLQVAATMQIRGPWCTAAGDQFNLQSVDTAVAHRSSHQANGHHMYMYMHMYM